LKGKGYVFPARSDRFQLAAGEDVREVKNDKRKGEKSKESRGEGKKNDWNEVKGRAGDDHLTQSWRPETTKPRLHKHPRQEKKERRKGEKKRLCVYACRI